jgi:hypothetical protein
VTFLLRNSSRQPTWLNRSDQSGKPIRPILSWTVGKNSTCGKNSNLQAIDLPLRSTDQNETLGIVGVPRGLPLARSSCRMDFPRPTSSVGEGPIGRTRDGGGSEWETIKILLEGDENSNKMNTASNTRLRLTTQVGQAHVATGVPQDLGTNTQCSDPRTQRNTKPRVH